MLQRVHVRLFTLFSALSVCTFAQGLDTRASKDDWEEINFEFDSAVLSDGFPSLLRLADLLKAIRATTSGWKATRTISAAIGITRSWECSAPIRCAIFW